MKEKDMPEVPVHFNLPIPYRQRLIVLRVEGGYKNVGEMVQEWIDEKAKKAQTREA